MLALKDTSRLSRQASREAQSVGYFCGMWLSNDVAGQAKVAHSQLRENYYMTRCKQEAGPILFVVAGPKSCGKSTLLRQSLQEGRCFFGEELEAEFTRFKPFCDPRAEMVALPDTIRANQNWFGVRHIPEVMATVNVGSVLLHVDIMSEIMIGNPRDPQNQRLGRRFFDTDRLLGCFRTTLSPLFLRYEKTAIATIDLPIEVVVDRFWEWSETHQFSPTTHFHLLYDRESPDEVAYANIYDAWYRFVDCCNVFKSMRIGQKPSLE